ncbi:Uncharacterized protein DAT39_011072, partial [Clarias magur]
MALFQLVPAGRGLALNHKAWPADRGVNVHSLDLCSDDHLTLSSRHARNSPTAALQLGPNLNSTPLISRIETEPQAECCGPYRSPAEIAAAGVKRKGQGRR